MPETEIRQQIANLEADNCALESEIKSLQDARRRNGEQIVMLYKELDGQRSLLPLSYTEAVAAWEEK